MSPLAEKCLADGRAPLHWNESDAFQVMGELEAMIRASGRVVPAHEPFDVQPLIDSAKGLAPKPAAVVPPTPLGTTVPKPAAGTMVPKPFVPPYVAHEPWGAVTAQCLRANGHPDAPPEPKPDEEKLTVSQQCLKARGLPYNTPVTFTFIH